MQKPEIFHTCHPFKIPQTICRKTVLSYIWSALSFEGSLLIKARLQFTILSKEECSNKQNFGSQTWFGGFARPQH